MLRSILHCDMNNFYASVECMLDPALKKYPIAVCGSVEERHGIVLAKNYKAKAFDVKTGDAVWQAKQKCKDLVVVPPHYEEYIKYSKLARSVYERYTDQVEPYGMDECWLDISGTESLFGSPEKVANEIRETMKFELGLTISVGVSFNKIFAKLGSDMKPNVLSLKLSINSGRLLRDYGIHYKASRTHGGRKISLWKDTDSVTMCDDRDKLSENDDEVENIVTTVTV